MFNKLLGKVDGVDLWMTMSLLIFGVFFIGVLISLFMMKKSRTEYLKNMPLTDNENKITVI
ncbi:MAG: hypothetical protein IT244_01805 [Bacteroidia bacterium]|nr:hypothetical protein [Bacteroidia bacterium]